MALVQFLHKGCGGHITWSGHCSKCGGFYANPDAAVRSGSEEIEVREVKA